jgi:hypothetical protein
VPHHKKKKKCLIVCECFIPYREATYRLTCSMCGIDVYQVPEIQGFIDEGTRRGLRMIVVCLGCESDYMVHPEEMLSMKGFNFIDLSQYTDEHVAQILEQMTATAKAT